MCGVCVQPPKCVNRVFVFRVSVCYAFHISVTYLFIPPSVGQTATRLASRLWVGRVCGSDHMLLLVVATGCAFITPPTDGDALLPRAVPTAMAGVEDLLKLGNYDQRREKVNAGVQSVELPTVSGRVDGPLVQTLATVCGKLHDHSLYTVFKPADGSEPNKKLEQPYKLVKAGGEYKEGGNYTADGVYTNGKGALVSGYDVFNKDTTQVVGGKSHGTASLASYGTVIDGFTDFHGEDQAAIPPFAALIVQPKDGTAVRTLPEAPYRSTTPPPVSLTLSRLVERLSPPPVSRLPTERETMLPASGRNAARAGRNAARPPSSSSPGADLKRCSTGSTISRSLPLSVCPPRRAPVHTEHPNPGPNPGGLPRA